MNKIGVDLIGVITLMSEFGRKDLISQEYWGPGNIRGSQEKHSQLRTIKLKSTNDYYEDQL